MAHQRTHGLDLVRAEAVLAVVVYHALATGAAWVSIEVDASQLFRQVDVDALLLFAISLVGVAYEQRRTTVAYGVKNADG